MLLKGAKLVAALSAPGPGALHLTRVVVLPDEAKISTSEREAVMHKAKQYLRTTVEHLHEGLVAPAVADLKLAITWPSPSTTTLLQASSGWQRPARRRTMSAYLVARTSLLWPLMIRQTKSTSCVLFVRKSHSPMIFSEVVVLYCIWKRRSSSTTSCD